MSKDEWNPRYVAYAKYYGKTPEEMKAYWYERSQDPDPAPMKFPTFVVWIGTSKKGFTDEFPNSVWEGNILHQDKWTQYLESIAEKEAQAKAEKEAQEEVYRVYAREREYREWMDESDEVD